MSKIKTFILALMFIPTAGLTKNYDTFCLNPPSTHASLLCKKMGRKQQYRSYAPKSSTSSPTSTKIQTQSFKEERIEKRHKERQRIINTAAPIDETSQIQFKPYTRGAYTKKQAS